MTCRLSGYSEEHPRPIGFERSEMPRIRVGEYGAQLKVESDRPAGSVHLVQRCLPLCCAW